MKNGIETRKKKKELIQNGKKTKILQHYSWIYFTSTKCTKDLTVLVYFYFYGYKYYVKNFILFTNSIFFLWKSQENPIPIK